MIWTIIHLVILLFDFGPALAGQDLNPAMFVIRNKVLEP